VQPALRGQLLLQPLQLLLQLLDLGTGALQPLLCRSSSTARLLERCLQLLRLLLQLLQLLRAGRLGGGLRRLLLRGLLQLLSGGGVRRALHLRSAEWTGQRTS
jgi:hypothetical protein